MRQYYVLFSQTTTYRVPVRVPDPEDAFSIARLIFDHAGPDRRAHLRQGADKPSDYRLCDEHGNEIEV